MKMKAQYLVFKDDVEAKKELKGFSVFWSKHDVGYKYNDDGVYDEETHKLITEPTRNGGYRVNVLVPDDCTKFDTWAVEEPETPDCVFAGY
ncbi:hypothetical protein VXS06_14365 [Photobacterium toruni]|uniref:Uncharacterized protein n=1 Tax=Photobacterium toruni TaxID=1935446 RepID=A0ABU6L8T1_9GAMM|nr:hypothetical protein [Photobacterium toruni]